MIKTIFANKLGMVGKFTSEGKRVGVTLLSTLPMKVKGLRTRDKHGYEAVQIEFASIKRKMNSREIRTQETPEVGTEIIPGEILKAGDEVQVMGVSKGKGFAGAVKRHGFAGGPRTHGQSDRERAPGSSGSGTTPGRVYKGKRRAGRMGNDRVTTTGLKVLEVDMEKNQISIIGSVPGIKSGLVTVTKV